MKLGKLLGKLEEVKLREIWKNEATDFTPWLSEQENLDMLGEILGLSLVEPEQEVSVGGYSCDIKCKVENDERVVVIENQIEQSNHDHLGKSIVYASGLGASIVVWIVKSARPEHASAIEWLNEHTDGNIGFFLLEIQAVKIGNSEPALQFKIISKPNDYEKAVKNNSGNEEKNRSQLGRYNFWTQMNEYIESNGYKLKTRKPSYEYWYNFALGSSKYYLTVTLLDKYNQIGVGLWISDDKIIFNKLHENKDEIESNLSFKIEWDEKKGGKASAINSRIDNFSFDDNENYAELDKEICERLLAFEKTLKPFFK
jgi:hypothetical protein